MIVKINGKPIVDKGMQEEQPKVIVVRQKDEVPDYVAWMVIALGILAIKGWLSLWN
jgi:hypothetical protein